MTAREALVTHYEQVGSGVPAWLPQMTDEECRNIAKQVIGTDEYEPKGENMIYIHISRREYRTVKNQRIAQERESFDTIEEAQKFLKYYQSIEWAKKDGYVFTLTTEGDPALYHN